MAHILVVSGHPDLNHSIANATILDELATALPDAEIRRLDWLYPDGKFNIAAEQESLLQADVIVWQFPFSWYGAARVNETVAGRGICPRLRPWLNGETGW